MLDEQGCFYATQRPVDKSLALHWEFPGGKVEVGEHPENALRREIEEELLWTVGEIEPLSEVKHAYDFGIIRLTPFLHRCAERPSLSLTEHIDSRWMHSSDWDGYTWAPADVPVVKQLLNEVAVYE